SSSISRSIRGRATGQGGRREKSRSDRRRSRRLAYSLGMSDQDQERLLEVMRRVLEGGKDARDDQAVEAAHPSDVAAILQHLPLEQQVALFRRLSAERAGEVLPSLDDTTLLTLVRALDEVEVSRILDEMPPEHAADSHRLLVGTGPWRRLLIAAPATAVLAIRDENVVSVPTGMDQEEVARVVAKYDLVAVAVVDSHHRLVGTITADDVVDIVGEE